MTSKLPLNLEDLLRQRTVEGERIEYKAGWNPDAVIRTLCAFANDFENLGGGYIIIGQDCDEQGRPVFPPVGVPDNRLDKIQRELLQSCNLIQPSYFPKLSIECFEGQKLFVLWAPGGLNRPYKAPRSVASKKKEYRYYIRRYSSTVEATGEDEQELIRLTASVPFDDRYCQSAKVDDLSSRLMESFLREVGSRLADDARERSAEDLGRQMNVVGGPSEAAMPKNVGLLFFNDEPHRFFPATQIDVVFFPEDAGGDRFEEKVFKGPLDRITRDAISFIERKYIHETVIKHADRPQAERFWNFPLVAIEEAVVNAVYHRSYEIREPVEIRITRDEDLVVLSFPGPDPSVSMVGLRAGKAVSRRYRNRRIGEFLKELDLTEGRSTGINKIIKAMAANGSPPPEFETDDGRTHFITRLPVHPKAVGSSFSGADEPPPQVAGEASGGVPLQVTPQVAGEASGGVPPQVAGEAPRKVPPQVGRLLVILDGELLREELQRHLGLADRKHFRAEYLQPALEVGLIEMTIPDKPRSSKQRYRLTDKGRAWLKDEGETS